MRKQLSHELQVAHAEIKEIAKGYGLDTFDVIFELSNPLPALAVWDGV